MASFVEELIKNEVTVETIRRGRYLVTVGKKGVGERNTKAHAGLFRAEWETYLSGIVVRTASACAAMIEKETDPKQACVKILEAVAQPLEELGIGYEGTEQDSP